MRKLKRTLAIVAMLVMAISANAYSWMSPYAYCMNNPVKFVDPDGRDNYSLNRDGTLELLQRTVSKTTDKIVVGNQSMLVGKNITKQLLQPRDDYNGSCAVGSRNMDKLFKFVADNTDVEWRLVNYNTDSGSEAIIVTSHSGESVTADNNLSGMKEENMISTIHSHPDAKATIPSGFGKSDSYYKDDYYYMIPGDKLTAYNISQRLESKSIKAPNFYMYHPASQTLTKYNKDRIISKHKVRDGKLAY